MDFIRVIFKGFSYPIAVLVGIGLYKLLTPLVASSSWMDAGMIAVIAALGAQTGMSEIADSGKEDREHYEDIDIVVKDGKHED